MSREEMIKILIEDKMWEWVYARNYDGLEDWLREGFDDWANTELKCAINELEEQGTIGEIKKMLKMKGKRE